MAPVVDGLDLYVTDTCLGEKEEKEKDKIYSDVEGPSHGGPLRIMYERSCGRFTVSDDRAN